MNALQGYRKIFAPIIPGLTDTAPIYAAYERMRKADVTQHTILLLVECQTMEEFREALDRLPIRKSSEWSSF
jgi:DNA repair photolyase